MINWRKVEWLDVALHAIGALAITGAFAGVGWWFTVLPHGMPWIGAFASSAVWYGREAWQHKNRGPWIENWGWGSQVEFYAPAFAGLLSAAIWTVVI